MYRLILFGIYNLHFDGGDGENVLFSYNTKVFHEGRQLLNVLLLLRKRSSHIHTYSDDQG